MTTVLVTRDFMITDCRVTRVRDKDTIYFDHKCKIDTDCVVVHKGNRIVAMAACGDVAASSHLKQIMKDIRYTGIELEVVALVLGGMPVPPDADSDYELICLTEDGECIIVENEIIHTGTTMEEIGRARTRMSLFQSHSLEDGSASVVFGSGGSIFDILEDRIDTSELSFVDIFYFAASLDSNSSNSYSAYSRVTNELFTTVNPTKKDITERINRVLKKINFTDPKYKKKHSINL